MRAMCHNIKRLNCLRLAGIKAVRNPGTVYGAQNIDFLPQRSNAKRRTTPFEFRRYPLRSNFLNRSYAVSKKTVFCATQTTRPKYPFQKKFLHAPVKFHSIFQVHVQDTPSKKGVQIDDSKLPREILQNPVVQDRGLIKLRHETDYLCR
jgi:hypothetical protein